VILFLLLSLAFGDEVITINEGEPAPFTGTLISPNAAAKLLASGESELARCLANSEKDKALLEADLNLKIKNKEAELASCTLKFTEYENIYKDQINYLEKRAVTPNWKEPTLFAGGVIVGIGVVAISAWTLEKIGD